MSRNRVVGAPFQPQVQTSSFTTDWRVDLYLVHAPLGEPVEVTLDDHAVQGDQVVIQDIGNNATSQPITINASPGQTILNGFGSNISLATNGGAIQLTFDQQLKAWAPIVVSASGGGGGPFVPTTWIAIASGGVATVQAGVAAAYEFDTTGTQDSADLPNTPTDGQVLVLKAVGASNTNGIRINPGAGQSLEDPGNPGTILAPNTPTTFFTQGGCLVLRYQAAGTRWLIQSNA